MIRLGCLRTLSPPKTKGIHPMRARLYVSLASVFLVAGYLASPAVALWNLVSAMNSGDVAALRRGVDWASVRAGMKQDISDGVIAAFGGPSNSTQLASNVLPPFGASFVSSIAGTAIDHDVTPENVARMARQLSSVETSNPLVTRIAHIGYNSLTEFTIALRGDDEDDGVLKLHLSLQNGHWVLDRAWIPQDMVEWVSQRT